MKPRSRLQVSLCCLGGLLFGSVALAQEDRAVLITVPTATKATGAKASRDTAKAAAPAQKRYWADHKGNAIKRSNLDGSQVETMVSNTQGPYGTSYDPATGHIIWTSEGEEKVQAAPADGSAGVITLNSSFEEHFAIVINGSERNVAYGVDEGQVIRLTQDRNTGAEQRDVLFTLSSPESVHGMALTSDQKTLYLGDSVGRMSQKLNLSTLSVEPLVYTEYASATATEPAAKSKTSPSSAEKSR